MNKMKYLPNGTSALLTLVGLGAVIYGIAFIFKPDGALLGLSSKHLRDTPFESFLVPGNILFFIVGMGSLLVGFLCYTRYHLAGTLTMCTGLFLILWILAFSYWFGWINWLMLIFLMVGLVEIFLGFSLRMGLQGEFGKFWKNRHLNDFMPWL